MSVQISIDHNTAGAGATQINNVTNNIAVWDENSVRRVCLKALHCPDPFKIKNRLKQTKDELLYDSFQWILSNEQYCKWQDDDEIGLLWIKGGAGKGKTMMLIGLIEALSRREPSSTVVTYFFCQNADSDLNTVIAIMKGLILRLIEQRESLWQVLLKRWNTQNACFEEEEDVSRWETLWNIFLEMISKCQSCGDTVFVAIDALDECLGGSMSDFLLALVRTGLQSPGQLKWLLTSRPLEEAENYLMESANRAHISFELSPELIATGIRIYIDEQIRKLAVRKKVDSLTYRAVAEAIQAKANGTFLWVSFVCKELQLVTPNSAMSIIASTSPELQDLYEQAYKKYTMADSETGTQYTQMLGVLMLAYRPLTITELTGMLDIPADGVDSNLLVSNCSTFVTTRYEDHTEYIEFVHQSARDYLVGLPDTSSDCALSRNHAIMASRCLSVLDNLKVNLFRCSHTSASRYDIVRLGEQPLAGLRYAAVHWISHLEAISNSEDRNSMLNPGGKVHSFLRCYFLQWLECLSLMDQLSSASEALDKLLNIFTRIESRNDSKVVSYHDADQPKSMPTKFNANEDESVLLSLVQDAQLFLVRYSHIILEWPLQVYHSALIFCPDSSVIKQNNMDRMPKWLQYVSKIESDWSSVRQILIHSRDYYPTVVAFSPNGKLLASGDGHTVKLWSVQTGQTQQNFRQKPSNDKISKCQSICFSPDGKLLACGNSQGEIDVWSVQTGQSYLKMEDLSKLHWVAFSPDGQLLASVSSNGTISTVKLWSVHTGQIQQTLGSFPDNGSPVAFSPDWRLLALWYKDDSFKLWSVELKQIQCVVQRPWPGLGAVAFSPDGQLLALSSGERGAELFSVDTGQLQKRFGDATFFFRPVAFSSDGNLLAMSDGKHTVRIWSMQTEQLQQELVFYSQFRSLAFSPDGQLLAGGNTLGAVKMWSIQTGQVQQRTCAEHSDRVFSAVISPDGRVLASSSDDGTLKLRSLLTGEVQQTISDKWFHDWIVFSPEGKLVAVTCAYSPTITLRLVQSGQIKQTLIGHTKYISSIAFSPDGQLLASTSKDETLKLWSVQTGQLLRTFGNRFSRYYLAAFSPDGQLLASEYGTFINSKTTKIKLLSVSSCLNTKSDFKRYLYGVQPELPTIQCPQRCSYIRFGQHGTQLITDIGRFYVSNGQPCEEPESEQVSTELSHDRDRWIICGTKRILCIPLEYDISCQDSNDDTIALGCASGQVLWFRIDRQMALSSTEP